jgi:tetratricopeptide (TPR) repeat protein
MGEMKHGVLLPAIALLVVIFSCTSRPEEDAVSGGERPAGDFRAALWLVQAQQALEQGALNNALILTDSAMHEAPELTDLYFLRARIFTDMQRLDLAEEAYFQVLDRDRTYEGAWLNLGNAAFRKRAYGRALERYRKELSAYPYASAYLHLGQLHKSRGALDQAVAVSRTCVRSIAVPKWP